MTAQDILERFGFYPLVTENVFPIGSVQVVPEGTEAIVDKTIVGCKLVIVGELPESEYRALEREVLRHYPNARPNSLIGRNIYKAVAE